MVINIDGEIKELVITDSNGIEWTRDLLGNHNIYADEDGIVHMDKENFEWWTDYINGHNTANEEFVDLSDVAD